MKRVTLVSLFCIFLVIIAACSFDNGKNADSDANTQQNVNGVDATEEDTNETNDTTEGGELEEITLHIMSPDFPEEFDEWYREPLSEKFPHITLEHIHINVDDSEQVEQVIVGGPSPDLIRYNHNGTVNLMDQYELTYDMSDLVEASNHFSLSDLRPGAMADLTSYERDGYVYAIPIRLLSWATLYNEDIFDRFGEAYPEDGMTWQDMIQIAQQLTREEDGIEYRGLDIGWEEHPRHQLSAQIFDAQTDHPMFLEDDSWSEFYGMLDEVFSIPGNYPDPESNLFAAIEPFINDQNIAMVTHFERISQLNSYEVEGGSLNWDMVTYPVFDAAPGVMSHGGGPLMGLTSMTEHEQEAFEIVEYLLSEEYQSALAEQGLIPSLDSDVIIESFANNLTLSDKNFAALFQHGYPPVPPIRENDFPIDGVGDVIQGGIRTLASGESDINTILRGMQEEAEEFVRQAQAQQ